MKKYKIELTSLARIDIKEARGWYNLQQKGLGKRLTVDLHNLLRSISNHPTVFSIRYKDYRLANLKKFPYVIHFTINEDRAVVYINAFVHASRHPDMVKGRSR